MQQRARNPVCIGLVLSASAIAQASYQGVAVSDPDKPSIIIDIDAQRDVPPGGGVPYDDVKKLTRTASSAPAAFTPVSQSTLYFVATRHDGCRYLFRYVTLKPTDEPNYAPVKAVQSGQPDVALLDPTHLVAFNGYLYCFGVGAGANRNLYRVQDLVATKLNLPPSTQAWNLHDLALGRASLMVAAGEASPTGDSTNLVLFTVPVTGLDCIKLASTAAGQSHLHVNDLVDCNSLAGGFVAFTELSDDGLTRQLRRGVVNGTNLEFSAPAVVPTGPITDLTPVGSTLYYTVVNYVLAPDASRTLWFAPNYSSATMTYVTTDVRTMVVTPYLGGKRLVVATGRRQMNNQVWAIDGTPLMIPPPQDTELYAITDLVTYLDDVHLLAVHRNVTLNTYAAGLYKVHLGPSPAPGIELVTDLPDWSNCHGLVANDKAATPYMAFLGDKGQVPTLRCPSVGSYHDSPHSQAITPLLVGSTYDLLTALGTELVFRAGHEFLGLEPWKLLVP